MSFNLPVILLLFWLLFGVFVTFLTPETIVLAIVFHACGVHFVPTIPKTLVVSIYRAVISMKKLYNFNLPSKNIWFQFTFRSHDFNLPSDNFKSPWHCQPCNFNLPSDSFNLPGHSPVISIYRLIISIYQDINSLSQPGDFNLLSDVYFRVFQFTVRISIYLPTGGKLKSCSMVNWNSRR